VEQENIQLRVFVNVYFVRLEKRFPQKVHTLFLNVRVVFLESILQRVLLHVPRVMQGHIRHRDIIPPHVTNANLANILMSTAVLLAPHVLPVHFHLIMGH
jgi:hypothetical protein